MTKIYSQHNAGRKLAGTRKYFMLLLCGFIFSDALNAQNMGLEDLIGLVSLSETKFDNQIRRKNYNFSGVQTCQDTLKRNYQFVSKKKKSTPNIQRLMSQFEHNGNSVLAYQTSCNIEGADLIGQLKKASFFYPPGAVDTEPVLFQKRDISVLFFTKQVDTVFYYGFLVEKKKLPSTADIGFAEDLLKIGSHEFLVKVFGQQNVKMDVFYANATRKLNCSVLFPNTTMEAVFVWEDQPNYRKIAEVRVGGHPQTETAIFGDYQVQQSEWYSSQGVYSGMDLRELERVNGASINFYEWNTESKASFATTTSGRINFEKLSLVLNCLNCDNGGSGVNLTNSSEAIRDSRRIFVSTMIVLPEKQKLSGSAGALVRSR